MAEKNEKKTTTKSEESSNSSAAKIMESPTKVKEGTILFDIISETKINQNDDGYEMAVQGLQAFLAEIVKPTEEEQRIDKKLVDAMIDELDKRLGEQVDEILHHEEFQKLESAWKSLQFLLNRTNFQENIKVQILDANKEEILDDFEDVNDVTKSGLYHHIYTSEYGQFGGEPVGFVLGNYSFSHKAKDVDLLKFLSSMSAMSHTPFVAGADASFFGVENFDGIASLKEIGAIFEGPQYGRWRNFRESDDARNIGLAMPRFMLRDVYGENDPVKTFNYQEDTNGDSKNYLWGNAAYAFSTCINDSFAKYRWCPNIVGPQSGGSVDGLPSHVIEENGKVRVIGPTEVALSDRKEYELSEQGFIAFSMRKGGSEGTFFSASSVQKPKVFGDSEEEKQEELNYRLGTQLPYLFIITRLAHYIKVLQRENLGSWKSHIELDRELNQWINQYVAAQDNPSPIVRSKKPLRHAEVNVAEVLGEAGWHKVELKVTPHIKFMGANFTLSLTGRLDQV